MKLNAPTSFQKRHGRPDLHSLSLLSCRLPSQPAQGVRVQSRPTQPESIGRALRCYRYRDNDPHRPMASSFNPWQAKQTQTEAHISTCALPSCTFRRRERLRLSPSLASGGCDAPPPWVPQQPHCVLKITALSFPTALTVRLQCTAPCIPIPSSPKSPIQDEAIA